MTDAADDSLRKLVAASQEHIRELRRAGELGPLLSAAEDAADDIEHQVGERKDDVAREALITVRRFTFNAAADAWPGWQVSDKPPNTQDLLAAQELARRSAQLNKKLDLGPLQEGTGLWLCGAFDIALGKYDEASKAFDAARQCYLDGKAPGLVLLVEGYRAILRQVAGQSAGGESLSDINARIAAGGFEDGAEWVAQLNTALKVFA